MARPEMEQADPLLSARASPAASRHSSRSTTPTMPAFVTDLDTSSSPPTNSSAPPSRRRNILRSRSPTAHARAAARRKYTLAAIFLVVSLISFTVQTQLAAWVQHAGWNKAYCMLYLTHGSWAMLFPFQLAILRARNLGVPWRVFWRRHAALLTSTGQMVQRQQLNVPKVYRSNPWPYLIKTAAFVTAALTVAGLSWYVAVDMTSPSDLTAIYNCSAFFAYVFSVPLLKEKLRIDKSMAVLIAIGGVLIVAYGDSKGHEVPGDVSAAAAAGRRFIGNLVIGVGSVLYGLYEVLYKRYACPPDGCSPTRGMLFANTFGGLIGVFTLTVMWIPLPILHILGWEEFAMPTGRVAWYLGLSIIMNATFAGSFLVLISLTSPVLSSVASLLTIFLVAVTDWFLTGEAPSFAALVGGSMIVVAFLLLSWSTYREMAAEEKRKEDDILNDDDSEWELEE